MPQSAARNDPEAEIELYLRRERLSTALRLLWVGAIAIVLGGAGSLAVYDWFLHGGVVLNLVLAGPLIFLAGLPVTVYALVLLVRARR